MGSKIGYPSKILNLTQLDLDYQEVNSSLIYIQFSLIPTKLFFNGLMSCTRTQAPPLAPTLELKKGLIRVRLFKTHIFKQH